MPFSLRPLKDLLDAGARTVLADPRGAESTDWLRANDRGSHIVLSNHLRGSDVRPYSDAAVLANNASILLLDGSATPAFLRAKKGPELAMVLIPLRRLLVSGRFLLAALRYFIRRRIRFAGVYRGGGLWLGFAMVNFKRAAKAHRFYMPDTWGLRDLAGILDAAARPYAVLGAEAAGGDMPALLTDDAGYALLAERFARQIATRAVTIHSLTDEAALFPMQAAQGILDRARAPAPGALAQPAPRDDFLISAYDAVYFQGTGCGLKSQRLGTQDDSVPARQVLAALQGKASLAGIAPEHLASLESLAAFLQEAGWQPARDTLSLYSRKNAWLHDHFFGDEDTSVPPGLAVFLVREIAEEWGALAMIEAELVAAGFTVLEKYVIPQAARVGIGNRIRGGNWGAGTWKTSGGLPACALVMADPSPKVPKAFKRGADIKLDNMRIMHKHVIRDKLNSARPPAEQANALHTSDNTRESLDYIAVLMGEEKKNDIYARFLALSGRG